MQRYSQTVLSWVSTLVLTVLLSLSVSAPSEATTVRASSSAPAKVLQAERIAAILQHLLQVNALQFSGEVRLVSKSGYHAEAFFGAPGYIQLGESYAQSLTDGELTFVLAHELAHLLTNHAERVRMFYANPTMAGFANPADLHHTLEADADQSGMQWALKAGARPEQAVSALKRAYSGLSSSYTTHPGLDKRSSALLAFQ